MKSRIQIWLLLLFLLLFVSVMLQFLSLKKDKVLYEIKQFGNTIALQYDDNHADVEWDKKKPDEMSEKIWEIFLSVFGSVIGGIIAAATGFWLFFSQRKRVGKDAFLIFLSEKQSQISSEKAYDFWLKTMEEFRSSIFKVKIFLSKEKSLAIDKEWNTYQKIDPNFLIKNDGAIETGESMKEFHKKFGGVMPDAKKTLNDYLEKFRSFAK